MRGAKGMEQITAALGLAGKILRREVSGDVVVGGGIPQGVIQAVRDAVQIGGAVAKDRVESAAELRRLDLLGVLAADGGDGVGVDDTALEKVEFVVELQA